MYPPLSLAVLNDFLKVIIPDGSDSALFQMEEIKNVPFLDCSTASLYSVHFVVSLGSCSVPLLCLLDICL